MEEGKDKLDKENQGLKKIIAKKVKSLEKKLEKTRNSREKLRDVFRAFYEFFTSEIKDSLTN